MSRPRVDLVGRSAADGDPGRPGAADGGHPDAGDMVAPLSPTAPLSAGQMIRRRRRALGWTQFDLAQMIGVAQTRISEVELGRVSSASADLVARICDELDAAEAMDVDFMLKDQDE